MDDRQMACTRTRSHGRPPTRPPGDRREDALVFGSAADREMLGTPTLTGARRNLIVIRTLVQDYEHIHTAIGISGNLLFVVGSVLFYKGFEQYHTLAVSLFVVGSVFMLIGSLGNGLRRVWQRREE